MTIVVASCVLLFGLCVSICLGVWAFRRQDVPNQGVQGVGATDLADISVYEAKIEDDPNEDWGHVRGSGGVQKAKIEDDPNGDWGHWVQKAKIEDDPNEDWGHWRGSGGVQKATTTPVFVNLSTWAGWVVPWSAAGENPWGALLQSVPGDASREEWARVINAFLGGNRLYVLSTRFTTPSFEAALGLKHRVESGTFYQAGPCFNPNTDNVNFTQASSQEDQKARDDRWLQVWMHMARAAKSSGGRVLQLVEPDRGLSRMQRAEADFAHDIGLRVEKVSIEAIANDIAPELPDVEADVVTITAANVTPDCEEAIARTPRRSSPTSRRKR